MNNILKKRYLFFLRHYNDIDNIAPAIYFLLAKKPEVSVDVVIYSWDYAYHNNENILFLSKCFNDRFSIEWLGSILGLHYSTNFSNILGRFYYKCRGKIFSSYNVDNVRSGIKVSNQYINLLFEKLIFEPKFPSLVVFDQNRSFAIAGIINALRHHGVSRIISLPVSPFTNINTLRSTDMVDVSDENLLKKHDYSLFDCVGVVDDYYLKSLNKTYSLLGQRSPLNGKAEVLGSIRFCPEWLKIRSENQLYDAFDHASSRVRIVLFLSDPRTNVFWDEVLRTIHFICMFHEFEIVVKPHTRKKIINANFRKQIIFADNISSSALIDWADIILFWGSSIALEGYMKGKFMACLDYVNGNRSIYSLLNAGLILRCRDDLHELLTLFPRNKDKIKYNTEAVSRLLNKVVFAESDVPRPDYYVDFLGRL